MPKLKVIFTQETIISRKEIIQIEYSPESRITSSRPSKKADEKEKRRDNDCRHRLAGPQGLTNTKTLPSCLYLNMFNRKSQCFRQ